MKSFATRNTLMVVALFWISFFTTPGVFAGEDQVRLLLNEGKSLNGLTCNEADMIQISKRFDWATILIKQPGARNLRDIDHAELESLRSKMDPVEQRQTAVVFYPDTCKNTCKGFATGTCVARACVGYRRRELHTSRATSNWCAVGTNALNFLLDDLVTYSKVSSSCSELLKMPRSIDCLYNVVC